MNKIRFGSAGQSESFYAAGYKSSLDMPKYLAERGLSAYEYPCSRGIRISQETARRLGEKAQEYDIALSIHAPYYINLASREAKGMENSKNYLLDSLQVAQWMGAKKVVFHPGGAAKVDRREAMERVLQLLSETLQVAVERGLTDVLLCPETMGKRNQLGSLEEVLEICLLDQEKLQPALDFGHLNAITGGGLKDKAAFAEVLIKVRDCLGDAGIRHFHAHFSPIEFTAAGEKKHWNLSDEKYGPDFVYLAELLAEMRLYPTIICESAGHQTEDAQKFLQLYENYSLS